MRFTSI
jgi:hypothetical protein